MTKYVVDTAVTFHQQYYVEVDDPEWACDGITCEELEPFVSRAVNESVLFYRQVDDWPVVDREHVNGAGYTCVCNEDGSFKCWEQLTLWDYAK
jgi:hypothetical protein